MGNRNKCDHKRRGNRSLWVKNNRWTDEPRLAMPVPNMNKRKCEKCNTVWTTQSCNARSSCGKERVLCGCSHRQKLHDAVGWHKPKHTYRSE